MSTLLRIYAIGLAIYIFSWLAAFFSVDAYLDITFIALFCFGLGFTIELVQTLKVIWDTSFAKIAATFLSLLSLLCWWTAKTLSSQTINLFIPVSPSKFPLATQAFTLMFFIFLWLILIGLFLAILPVILLFTPYKPTIASIFEKKPPSLAKYPALVGRAAGSFAIFFLIASLLFIPMGMYKDIVRLGSTVLALTDHYTFSTCSNHDTMQGERVAFLDNNQINVAIPLSEGGYNFEIRECWP